MRCIICLFICLCFLLTGCADMIKDVQPTPQTTAEASPSHTSPAHTAPRRDSIFTLQYNEADKYNPFTCKNEINRIFFPLLYKPLFVLTPEFEAVPVLAEAAEYQDGVLSITLAEGLKFSDGSDVSVWDAMYSINRARESNSVYAERLKDIVSVEYNDGRIDVKLSDDNHNYAALLNIPVVKEGTAYLDLPVGVGDYTLRDAGEYKYLEQLQTVEGMPNRIYLAQYESDELTNAYGEALIDLMTGRADPLSLMSFSGSQQRNVDTAILHFIGFSGKGDFFGDAAKRRLLSLVVDRNATAAAIGGRATTTVINPVCAYYTDTAEKLDFAAECLNTFTEDYDADGTLEYIAQGEPKELSINFIVCTEDMLKLAAAEKLCDSLRQAGFGVKLRKLNKDSFMRALKNDDYDMFYASVRLTADFNPGALLYRDGSAHYGLYDASVDGYIYDFLKAEGEAKKAAAAAMNRRISEFCAIIPIAFEQRAVYTHSDGLNGLMPVTDPTWENVFYKDSH